MTKTKITQLLKVTFCDGCNSKWCHYKCLDIKKNKKFKSVGKYYDLGCALEKSGIDVSYWYGSNFYDVIKTIIDLEESIQLIWNKQEYYYDIDSVTGDLDLLKLKLELLKEPIYISD